MRKVIELTTLIGNGAISDLITSSTSTTYLDKLFLGIIPVFSGRYKLSFYCETAISLVAQRVFVRIFDGVNIYAEVCPPVKENYANGQWLPISGFVILDLTKNVPFNVALQFKVSGGTGYIRRARILIERIFIL